MQRRRGAGFHAPRTFLAAFNRSALTRRYRTFDVGKHRKCPFAAWLPNCSAAPSGQVPQPLRGAPKARDLTAKARTELPFTRRETDYGSPVCADWLRYNFISASVP
jgi:hypothetical protein